MYKTYVYYLNHCWRSSKTKAKNVRLMDLRGKSFKCKQCVSAHMNEQLGFQYFTDIPISFG